jgi:hypothetical protein
MHGSIMSPLFAVSSPSSALHCFSRQLDEDAVPTLSTNVFPFYSAAGKTYNVLFHALVPRTELSKSGICIQSSW